MAMSVTYVTVHGRLREETRGGVTTRYLGDTLGSVIKTTDTSGNVTSTTTYWPFGEVRSQTGTNPSPWGFCGVWGYLTDAVSRMYVRARHYRADTSRWLTVDLLWPSESAYGYCGTDPIAFVDPMGLGRADSFFRCFQYLRYIRNLPLSDLEICEACKRYSGSTIICRPEVIDIVPVPYIICSSSDYISKAQLREFCDQHPNKKVCLDIVKTLGGNNCRALWAKCQHIGRHGAEFGKKAYEHCMALYNLACSGAT